MDKKFLDQLPEEMKALVYTIEGAAGFEIEVTERRQRKNLGCTIAASSIQVLTPDFSYFPVASVYHELLHAQRIIVEGIPRLVLCDDENLVELISQFSSFDNNFEHLFVVPQELKAYPERAQIWEKHIERVLGKVKEMQDPSVAKFSLQEHLPFIRHVLRNEALEGAALSMAMDFEIVDGVVAYSDAFLNIVNTKEDALRFALVDANFPRRAACLEYFIDTPLRVREEKLFQ